MKDRPEDVEAEGTGEGSRRRRSGTMERLVRQESRLDIESRQSVLHSCARVGASRAPGVR